MKLIPKKHQIKLNKFICGVLEHKLDTNDAVGGVCACERCGILAILIRTQKLLCVPNITKELWMIRNENGTKTYYEIIDNVIQNKSVTNDINFL